MKFPSTNKIKKPVIDQNAGENLALLEQKIQKANWRYLLKAYAVILGVVLVSLFLLIVVIRLALSI